jgi:hypothetical protein
MNGHKAGARKAGGLEAHLGQGTEQAKNLRSV